MTSYAHTGERERERERRGESEKTHKHKSANTISTHTKHHAFIKNDGYLGPCSGTLVPPTHT